MVPEKVSRLYYSPEKAAKKFGTSQSHLRVIEKTLGIKVRMVKRGSMVSRQYDLVTIDIIGKVIQANNLGVQLSVINRYGIKNLDAIIEFFSGLKESTKYKQLNHGKENHKITGPT